MDVRTFADLHLLDSLRHTLDQLGFPGPTPVQAAAIPQLMGGASTLVVAPTGSGKTLAFGLPLLHRLKERELGGDRVTEPGRPRGLVVLPRRELGEQISRALKQFTHHTRVRVRTALGGEKPEVSRRNVEGAHEVLIATPGRLELLMGEGVVALDDVATVIFDEADELLDAGFLASAQRLLSFVPTDAQRVLVTATLPEALTPALDALRPMSGWAQAATEGVGELVETLTVQRVTFTKGQRFQALAGVLEADPLAPTILFANTRGQCDRLCAWLDDQGYGYVAYRGEQDRLERRRALRAFRAEEVGMLVTTDLGGRGLDIEQVERVINVWLTGDPAAYLHRAGRTARAGREGLMVDLVGPDDHGRLKRLPKR